MQDLQSTDQTQETCATVRRSCRSYGPHPATWARADHAPIWNRPALKGLDDLLGIYDMSVRGVDASIARISPHEGYIPRVMPVPGCIHDVDSRPGDWVVGDDAVSTPEEQCTAGG